MFGFEVEKAVYRTIIQSLGSSSDPSLLLSVYHDVGPIFSKPHFVSLIRHCIDPNRLPDARAAEELVTGPAADQAASGSSGQRDLIRKINDLSRLLALNQSEKLACFLAFGIDPEPLISCGEVAIGKCTRSHPEVDHFLLTALSLNPNHSSIRSQLQEAFGGETIPLCPSFFSSLRLMHARV